MSKTWTSRAWLLYSRHVARYLGSFGVLILWAFASSATASGASTSSGAIGCNVYHDGELVKPPPMTRNGPRLGRDEPCHYGSAKNIKKSCGA